MFDEMLVSDEDPKYLNVATFVSDADQGVLSRSVTIDETVTNSASTSNSTSKQSATEAVDPIAPSEAPIPSPEKQKSRDVEGCAQLQHMGSVEVEPAPPGMRKIRVPRTVITKKPYVSKARKPTATLNIVKVEASGDMAVPGEGVEATVTASTKKRIERSERRAKKSANTDRVRTGNDKESRYSNSTSKKETSSEPGGLTVVKKRIAQKEVVDGRVVMSADSRQKSRQAEATATYVSRSERNSQNIKEVMMKLLDLVAVSKTNVKSAEGECSSLRVELDQEQKKGVLMSKQLENYKEQLTTMLKKTVGKQDSTSSSAVASTPRRYSTIHRDALGVGAQTHGALPLPKQKTFVGEDGRIETVVEEDHTRTRKPSVAEAKGIKTIKTEKKKDRHDIIEEEVRPNVVTKDMACGPDKPPPEFKTKVSHITSIIYTIYIYISYTMIFYLYTIFYTTPHYIVDYDQERDGQ